jgi:hypothetical protein
VVGSGREVDCEYALKLYYMLTRMVVQWNTILTPSVSLLTWSIMPGICDDTVEAVGGNQCEPKYKEFNRMTEIAAIMAAREGKRCVEIVRDPISPIFL